MHPREFIRVFLFSSLFGYAFATDCSILASAWTAMGGSGGGPSGTTSTSCCSFAGVTCSGGRVSQLNWSSQSLSGPIPSTLGSLTALTSLSLASNSLTGSIPTTFTSLSSLATLDLHSNQLSGTFPNPTTATAYSALITCNLASNSNLCVDGANTLPAACGSLSASCQCSTYYTGYGFIPYVTNGTMPASSYPYAISTQSQCCTYWQTTFSVVPATSWGTLGANEQLSWGSGNMACNIYITPYSAAQCNFVFDAFGLIPFITNGTFPVSMFTYVLPCMQYFYNTTTLVMGSSGGLTEGAAGSSKFRNPSCLQLDPVTKNIYVVDTVNHRIRLYTNSTATLSTYAGSSQGYLDGQGTSAKFYQPYGIVIDSSNRLYVSDTNNHVIRQISASGYVSTFAGIPSVPGYVSGTSATAQFNTPYQIAITASGNILVADYSNNAVRLINSAGQVSTFSGSPAVASGYADGPNSTALFFGPKGITIDSNGNIFVADYNNNAIRRLDASGGVTTWAGKAPPVQNPGLADGQGTTALFNGVWGLSSDAFGNIYVADYNNGLIRVVSSWGYVGTVVQTAANIANPRAVFYDSSTLSIYYSTGNSQRIYKFWRPLYSIQSYYLWYGFIPFVTNGTLPAPLYDSVMSLPTTNVCQFWATTYNVVPFVSWGTLPANEKASWQSGSMNCDLFVTPSSTECQYFYDTYQYVPGVQQGTLPSNLLSVAALCTSGSVVTSTTSSSSTSTLSSTASSSSTWSSSSTGPTSSSTSTWSSTYSTSSSASVTPTPTTSPAAAPGSSASPIIIGVVLGTLALVTAVVYYIQRRKRLRAKANTWPEDMPRDQKSAHDLSDGAGGDGKVMPGSGSPNDSSPTSAGSGGEGAPLLRIRQGEAMSTEDSPLIGVSTGEPLVNGSATAPYDAKLGTSRLVVKAAQNLSSDNAFNELDNIGLRKASLLPPLMVGGSSSDQGTRRASQLPPLGEVKNGPTRTFDPNLPTLASVLGSKDNLSKSVPPPAPPPPPVIILKPDIVHNLETKKKILTKVKLALRKLDQNKSPEHIDQELEIVPNVGPLLIIDHMPLHQLANAFQQIMEASDDKRFNSPYYFTAMMMKKMDNTEFRKNPIWDEMVEMNVNAAIALLLDESIKDEPKKPPKK